MRLKDKITVIAGAGCKHGMGKGFPYKFAEEGSNLVLNYYGHSQDKMEEMADDIRLTHHVKVVLVEGDMSKEETAIRLVDAAMKEFGRIDVLLNVTGINQPQKYLAEMAYGDWNRMIAVNLGSVFLTCRHVVPIMIKQKYGRIINITSQTGQKGAVQHCHYAASKAGIIGFTKSLAREVGQYNITVNCIAPGPIDTVMMGTVTDEWRKNKLAELVIPKLGEIEEVLPSAIFLASDPDGNLYTGQTLGPNQGDVML